MWGLGGLLVKLGGFFGLLLGFEEFKVIPRGLGFLGMFLELGLN
jgi:hypothetical protein